MSFSQGQFQQHPRGSRQFCMSRIHTLSPSHDPLLATMDMMLRIQGQGTDG